MDRIDKYQSSKQTDSYLIFHASKSPYPNHRKAINKYKNKLNLPHARIQRDPPPPSLCKIQIPLNYIIKLPEISFRPPPPPRDSSNRRTSPLPPPWRNVLDPRMMQHWVCTYATMYMYVSLRPVHCTHIWTMYIYKQASAIGHGQ